MTISGRSGLLLLLLLVAAVSVLTSAAERPSLRLDDHQHMDRIIEAMIGAGDFRDWAGDFLSAVNDQFGIPLSATLFIPDAFDAAAVTVSSSGAGAGGTNRLAVAYHIVPRRLSFSELLLMMPLTRLPTLFPGTSIVITNNSASGFAIDGVRITSPDLFVSTSIAIHGVASPLDVSLYGGGGGNNGGDGAFAGSLVPRTRKGQVDSASASATTATASFSALFLSPVAMAAVFAMKILF